MSSPQRDITKPLEDADNNKLLELPQAEPTVDLSRHIQDQQLPEEYVDALLRIARDAAVEGGWSAAVVQYVQECFCPNVAPIHILSLLQHVISHDSASQRRPVILRALTRTYSGGDVHDTTTDGSHRPSKPRPGKTVIGSGKVTVRRPDDPHITVAMTSKYFPSANITYHILTAMSNPATRNLRERKEIWSSRLYPGGFPFHQLISGGLSEQSASCVTPKQAYTRMINKWKWKQTGKAKKEAMKNFSDSEDDGPGPGPSSKPPGGSGSGAPGGNGRGATGGGSQKAGGQSYYSILESLTEEGPSDSVGNPAYYADVATNGKVTTQMVSVLPLGYLANDGKMYYCFNQKGDALSQAPPVSKKDAKPARAKQLYKFAVGLYAGSIASSQFRPAEYDLPVRTAYTANPGGLNPGVAISGYHYQDAGSDYRPPSRDSTAGYDGHYTARPASRDSADPYGHHASSWAAVPRTLGGKDSTTESRPPSSNGSVTNNTPLKKPSSASSKPPASGKPPAATKPASKSQKPRATAPTTTPSKSSSTPAPEPPRKMRPAKSKDVYTVHGLSKGAPYIKGLDKRNPDSAAEVQYSQKEKQFYVKPGSERIWLKEVK